MRFQALYLSLFSLPIILGLSLPGWADPGTVKRVSDGDTIRLMGGEKVRFLCMDAPEVAHDEAPDQAFGRESRQALKQLIPPGTTVDIRGDKEDKYGRTLGLVFVGQVNVNLRMVELGMAHAAYLDSCPMASQFEQAEAVAKSKKLGLWADPNVIDPYVFRRMFK